MNTGRSRQRRGHVHRAPDRLCSRTLVVSTRPRKASRPLTEIATSVRRVVRNAWCIGVLAVPRTVSPVASLVVVADFEALFARTMLMTTLPSRSAKQSSSRLQHYDGAKDRGAQIKYNGLTVEVACDPMGVDGAILLHLARLWSALRPKSTP